LCFPASRLSIGGQKYLVPSDVATFNEAKALCESRNMDVATFETPKERDMVSDFVGALSGELFFYYQ
jgi:hypothetical protein